MDSSFNQKKIQEEVTDTGIQRILLRHLQLNDNNPDIAFSPDGIERMNQNMNILNDGKGHQPIYKVRTYEKAESFILRGKQAGYIRAAYEEYRKSIFWPYIFKIRS